MSLQEVGSLEFADGCWQGSVLAGVGCSLIRGLFLIYDLLPYIVSWYKQTGSDSSWLQNCPGAGTQPGLARGPKQLSSVYWERLGGRAVAGRSEQVAAQEQLERGKRELLRGQRRAESLKLSILCCALPAPL